MLLKMHFIRFLVLFVLFVQFNSSISLSSSTTSFSTASTPSFTSSEKIPITTSKPKKSFTSHFTKIFSPFRKLFRSESKNNTQLNTSALIDHFNKSELSNENSTSLNQLKHSQLKNELIADRSLSNSSTLNEISNLNLTLDDYSIDVINLNSDLNLPTTKQNSSLQKKSNIALIDSLNDLNESNNDRFINESNNEKMFNKTRDHNDEDSKITYSEQSIQVTTASIDVTTTTSLFYKKKVPKLKEDEVKICFEIDELNVRKCYVQVPNTSNFAQSKSYCETHFHKGKLITINTADEQSFLILNSVYYFWTAFKIRLGLMSDLKPYIAAIKPIYNQTNASIELIKKFNFNKNLVFSQTELNELTAENKWTSFSTNDDDVYDKDDIRLEEMSDSPVSVLVPKLYCLEASLHFEDGEPLYKWVVKDCNQETSSSVCELSEPLVEEVTNSFIREPIFKMNNKTEDRNIRLNESNQTDKTHNKINNGLLFNEQVNNLVNQFLSQPSNGTKEVNEMITKYARQKLLTSTESNYFEIESSEDEHLKAILSDIFKEDLIHSTTEPTTTMLTTLQAKLSAPETTPIPTSTLNATNSLKSTDPDSNETSTESTLPVYLPIDVKPVTKSIENKFIGNNRAKIETCKNEPIIDQIIFAVYLAFNCLCELIVNLVGRKVIAINDVKSFVSLFIIIILLLIVLSTISIISILICKYVLKIVKRKRRLLLEQLSNQRAKKDPNVATDKSYDNSCYYNIPNENLNIYVSNPQKSRRTSVIENSQKYRSIPKEYFY